MCWDYSNEFYRSNTTVVCSSIVRPSHRYVTCDPQGWQPPPLKYCHPLCDGCGCHEYQSCWRDVRNTKLGQPGALARNVLILENKSTNFNIFRRRQMRKSTPSLKALLHLFPQFRLSFFRIFLIFLSWQPSWIDYCIIFLGWGFRKFCACITDFLNALYGCISIISNKMFKLRNLKCSSFRNLISTNQHNFHLHLPT